VATYDPGRSPCAVDLSDNADLRGTPPAVRRLLADAAPELVTRYPTPYSVALKAALAARLAVGPENVAVGCGSDDLLGAALGAFCEPGTRVAYPPPTFGVVPTFARVAGARPVPVRLRDDLSLDVEGLLAAGAAVTYLCSPNNPTGTAFPAADVDRLAAGGGGLLVLDEAYSEFVGGGLLASEDVSARRAAGSRRVVVLRTLSKAWGLAGLRVGYAIGPAALVAAIEKCRGPFKVGALAEAAALAVLRDEAWCREGVRLVLAERERVTAELRARGWQPLESAANFLFVPVPAAAGGARELARALRTAGVAVRPFTELPVVGEGIRVGLGPRPLMDRFLAALDSVAPAPSASHGEPR
jgi:histidinol-phosphate aminotransferase